MSDVEITRAPSPSRPNRTIYTLAGPSFEAVQLEIENLMECKSSFQGHFTIPFYDRVTRIWFAYGTMDHAQMEAAE